MGSVAGFSGFNYGGTSEARLDARGHGAVCLGYAFSTTTTQVEGAEQKDAFIQCGLYDTTAKTLDTGAHGAFAWGFAKADKQHGKIIAGNLGANAGGFAHNAKIVAAGGRVLGVTALGKNVSEAQTRAYQAVDMLDWPSGFCRRDIGWRAVQGS